MNEGMEEELVSEQIESSEEKLNLKRFLSVKSLTKLFFLFLFLNAIYVDILLIQGVNKKIIVQRFEKIINQAPSSENKASPPSDVCPQSCVTKIQQAVISNKQIAATPTPASTPVSNSPSQNINASQVKEYYVPFGSGSGSSVDWQDVAGLQATVDSGAYANIKSVVFEVSLHIPTGNETASVRLYNATDNHPVWNSDLTFNGNTNSVMLVSPSINLDSGNKLYKVQMKTQLKYQVILDQSRLHIMTK